MANDEAIEALLARSTAAVRDIAMDLIQLIRGTLPRADEQVDAPDRLIAWGYAMPAGRTRPSNFVVGIIPHGAHVNVQLAHGAHLPDPTGIVEGTGKNARHVKCRSREDVTRPALAALIEAERAMGRGGTNPGR